MSDLIGQSLGNYQITSVIGEGGMGTVYLGEHRTLKRRAAVKVLKRQYAAEPNMVKRFVEEARAASAVAHPNIVDIYDVGTLVDGLPFMLMEYLAGESLGRRLGRVGRLSPEEARAILVQASAALEAVHERNVVHRDLKPDNLFLIPDPLLPGGERVKVLDFGVAKLRGDMSSGGVQTKSGTLLGTPQYMSPEQCRGLNDQIDPRTDIYALGVILYEMLCGEPPFAAPSFGDLVVLHVTTPPPRPSEKRPDIPPELERAILRALEKDPDDRFRTMADFRRALGTAALPTVVGAPARGLPTGERPVTPTTTTLSGTAGETLRVSFYRRAPFVVGGVAVAVVVAGVLALGRRSDRGALPPAATAPAPATAPVSTPPMSPPPVAPAPPAMPTSPPAPAAVPAASAAAPPPTVAPAARGASRSRRRLAFQPAAGGSSPDAGAVVAAPDAPAPASPPAPARPKSEKW